MTPTTTKTLSNDFLSACRGNEEKGNDVPQTPTMPFFDFIKKMEEMKKMNSDILHDIIFIALALV